MTERAQDESDLEAKKRTPLILSGDPWPEEPAWFSEEVGEEGHAVIIVPAETWRRAKKNQQEDDDDESCE